MSRFFDTKKASGIVTATLMSFLLVALFTYAATTISTNINTGGTLTVTGASNFTGAVWATSTLQATGAALLYSTLQVDGAGTFNGAVTLGDAAADAIVFTGNASTTNSLTVGNNLYVAATASSTSLIVGGDSTAGTIAGMVFGTCNLTSSALAASTTKSYACTSATGVRSGDKVFVSATSTLGRQDVHAISASSTTNGQIQVDVLNVGNLGASATVAGTLFFWAVR